MKKLSCLLTVLLFAGVSFAQTSTADITQYGKNIGEINQEGTGDNASITEGTSSKPVTNFGTNGAGDWKYGAFISQTAGNGNDAQITITESGDGASIDQQGNNNEAYMSINTYATITTNFGRMGADINQVGDNNYASQTTEKSFGTFGVQGILIDQLGDNNNAIQYSKGGMASTVEIYQNGDNNSDVANVSKTTLADPLALPWAHKTVSGEFTQYQDGNNSVAHISVTGDANMTVQYQEYSVWSTSGHNSATLDITGNSNNVAQAQLGESNVSDIDMTGDLNVVGTSQLGNDNTISVGITGNSNIAGVEQVGNDKECTVLQSGNGNFSQCVQH